MKFFFFAFFLLITPAVMAQISKADTTFLTEAKQSAILLYNDQLFSQSRLINGSKHVRIESSFRPSDNTGREHPYYSLEWMPGKVLYGGEWYSSTFRYDLSKDKLITPSVLERGQTQLISENIKQFTLGAHNFVHLREQQLPEGFYEIIYDGITKAYVRLRKIEETQFRDNRLVAEFVPKTSYYIQKNGTFYEVKSKRSVLKLLSERKPELKKFLQTQSQPFVTNRSFYIREMARIYDQLKTAE